VGGGASVGVGGTGVAVRVAVGPVVAVGGTAVGVRVAVGTGVLVATGVFVGTVTAFTCTTFAVHRMLLPT
jgi:hypothetical protein